MQRLRELLERDVVAAAPALLGTILVHGSMRARIVETEAYRGADDPACHAFGKRIMKNMAMFGPPGHAYIYLNYGVHWMLNVVAHPPGDGSAVLIRAAVPLAGLEQMRANRGLEREADLLSGPGKLARAMAITQEHNALDLLDPRSELRIEAGEPVPNVRTGTRIGLAVGKGEDRPWRFVDADALKWISRPHP